MLGREHALAVVGLLALASVLATPALAARPSPTPTASPTATVKPKPSTTAKSSPKASPSSTALPPAGTLPAGSTRTNPLPSSPTAPALITVDPSTIDPEQENTLAILGRNLSQDTIVQIGTVGLRIADAPDASHLIVVLRARALTDGTYTIGLTNPDGQFDDAIGALTAAHRSGVPVLLYWIGGALVAGFVLLRVLRWLVTPSAS
jgi:hypothetical protein